MRLEEIIKDCGALSVKGDAGIGISFVTNDSRKVRPGSLFVAVSGCGNDGRDYIPAAIKAGAAAVICEGPCPDTDAATATAAAATAATAAAAAATAATAAVVKVEVADSRYAAAIAADRFYGHPSGSLRLVGITGTNGKTTTVTLLYEMYRKLGYECGLLSTIANYVGTRMTRTSNTTSDPFTINSLLREMVDAGCEYCFMEVSSIGVAQQRVAGLEFTAGIFSNLTHDHLDYHGSFAEYLRCKQVFFDNLPKEAFAITNTDDRNGMIMVQNTRAKVVSYSCRSMADHKCRILEESFEGMLLNIDGTEVWTRLIGAHNAYNLLAIYATAVTLGADAQEVLVAMSSLNSAKGRLETVSGPRGLNVVIDYAHTPDALENVLRTLRDVAPQRQLFCVFGCGGDRDRTKRPEMAEVAARLADRIILTSDNSRSERTEDIMEDMRKGMDAEGLARTLSIADRKEAIRTALTLAPAGSTILLAGKGHETYQITGTQKTHFDEREIVDEIFKSLR